ncbi:MAG TPA: response regulator [Nitrospirales bacterium]|jgi:CheY-like chemotaxis protein
MGAKIILLVEDNPDDEALTIRALKKSRVTNEVVVVHDGVEALEYLFGTGAYRGRDISKMPALIMLDLKMPKIDGLEVLEKLRREESTKYLPVVILTSSKEEYDVARGYQKGCNSYVRKPIDFKHFSDAVGDLGMYWLLHNESPPLTGSLPGL